MATCDSICIGEWIFMFLWIISVPTYCLVIYTIWKHRKTKFKGEFWFLTISLFIADMFHLCQYMWTRKISAWGLVPAVLLRNVPKLVAWFMVIPHVALFLAEVMGVVFVSINRYLAIMKPAHHSTWTRKTTVICICAQWVTAVFVLLYHVPVRFSLVQNPVDNGSTFISVIDPEYSNMESIFIGLVFGLGGLLRVLLFTILYGQMFYYVYKHERMVAPILHHQQRSPAHHESNLVVIGSLLAFCDMGVTMNAMDFAIHSYLVGGNVEPDQMRIFIFRFVCFTEVYGWMNGWLLLAFSRKVRNQFFKQYHCVKPNPVTHVLPKH